MSEQSAIPQRDGSTYEHARDGDPEASVSARLRDLRKPRFGGHNIQRRYVERGLFTYRLEAQKTLFP